MVRFERRRGWCAVWFLLSAACGNTAHQSETHESGSAGQGGAAEAPDSNTGGDGLGNAVGGAGGESQTTTPAAGAGGDCTEGCTPTCEPNSFLCDHNDLYQCGADASTLERRVTCEDWQKCNAMTGVCDTSFCVPGERQCDATTITECNVQGTHFEVVEDCANREMACVDGECRARVCEAGEVSCEGTKILRCDLLGASNDVVADCESVGAGLHCSLDLERPNAVLCAKIYCIPGDHACAFDTVRTCNAEGTSYLPGGTPCQGDTLCRDGQCLPVLCKGLRDCKDNSVITCADSGLSYSTLTQCAADQKCVTLDNSASCVPL